MKEEEKMQVRKMIERAMAKALDFKTRKLGDMPTDSYQLTPQQYVDLNGSTANRPKGANIGQQYFSSTLGYPIYFRGDNWVSATGSIVAAP